MANSPNLRSLLPVLAATVTVVLWASAFVVVRGIGQDYSPGALALGRLVTGSLALSAVVLAQAGRRGRLPRLPRGRVLFAVVAWGVGQFGLYTLSFNAAEQFLDAGTTSLLVNVAPVIVAVLAGLLLGEGFPARLLIGLAIAFGGVTIIAITTSTGTRNALGVALGLSAAALAAVGMIGQKRLLARFDPLTLTWLGCTAGILPGLPFAGELVRQVAAAPVNSTLWMVFLGLFPTSVAFFTWAFALSHTHAGRLAASTYAVPPIVVLMSWAFLSEVPPPLVLVGGLLCLGGVAVATLRPSRLPAANALTTGDAPEPAN